MLTYLPPTAAPLSPRALLSGLLPRTGSRDPLSGFEAQLRQYLGSQAVFAFTSGRAALRVILEAIQRQPERQGRRQVILPAYSCPVLVKAVQDAGLVPRLCDISPASLDYDPEQLQQLAGSQTLALLHVHLFGLPRDPRVVEAAAARSQALLIDDACQSLGSTFGQHQSGSGGVLGFASFGPGKPLSLGGGGLLSVNSTEWLEPVEGVLNSRSELQHNSPGASLAAWLRLLALNFIFQPAGWRLATWLGLHKMGDDQKNWGYRLRRLTAAQARTGQAALPGLDSLNQQRRRNAQALWEAIRELPGLNCVASPPEANPACLRFPLLVEQADTRELIHQRLSAAGIGVGKMYRMTLAQFFPQLDSSNYPGADYTASHLLTLPVHPYVKDKHIEMMVDIIKHITANSQTGRRTNSFAGAEHAG